MGGMKSWCWATLKHHYALIPLAGALGFAMSMTVCYTIRLAVQNPDTSWRRYTNPEPWQHRVDENGKTRRYKFFQGSAEGLVGVTKYGVDAFDGERPPIEKLWGEYQAAHKAEDHHH